jgi:transposase
MEVVDTGRRRRWSDAEKLRIVEESYRGHRQASATARRHGISRALLHRWRRDAREGVLSQGEQPPAFIRATVVDTSGTDRSQGRPETGGRMEIALSNGRRVTVGPDVDVEALRRVLAVVDET